MRLDDAPAVAALMNANCIEAFGEPGTTAADLCARWSDPSWDLQRLSLVVTAADGTLAAALFVASDPPFTQPTAFGDVAAPHRGRGLGTAMIGLADRMARTVTAAAPAGSTPVLRWVIAVTEAAAAALLRGHGFVPVRRTWLMRLSLAGSTPAVPAWPAGIAVRTFERSRDERAVYDAVVEGFADHWGDEESTFESFVHGSIDAAGERYDPGLWFLAVAGDEIAGVALCLPNDLSDPESAYVDALAVRPAFRRRGIARALLLHAFAELRARGVPRVALHVDASSSTGATQLYEGVGMTALPRGEFWERPL